MIINQGVGGSKLKVSTDIYTDYQLGKILFGEWFMCLDQGYYYNGLGWVQYPLGMICSIESYAQMWSEYNVMQGSFDITINDITELDNLCQQNGWTSYYCIYIDSEWNVTAYNEYGEVHEVGNYTTAALESLFNITIDGTPVENDDFNLSYMPDTFTLTSATQGSPIYKTVSIEPNDWGNDDGGYVYTEVLLDGIVCGDTPVIIWNMNNVGWEDWSNCNVAVRGVQNVLSDYYGALKIVLSCNNTDSPYLDIQLVILPDFGHPADNDEPKIVLSTGESGIQP